MPYPRGVGSGDRETNAPRSEQSGSDILRNRQARTYHKRLRRTGMNGHTDGRFLFRQLVNPVFQLELLPLQRLQLEAAGARLLAQLLHLGVEFAVCFFQLIQFV